MLVFLWALRASPEQMTMVCAMHSTGKQPWVWDWHLNGVAFWGLTQPVGSDIICGKRCQNETLGWFLLPGLFSRL